MRDWIERALDHRQQRDLERHAAPLQFGHDVEHVLARTVNDACKVVGAFSVELLPLRDQWVVKVVHRIAGTYAIPEIGRWRFSGHFANHADQRRLFRGTGGGYDCCRCGRGGIGGNCCRVLDGRCARRGHTSTGRCGRGLWRERNRHRVLRTDCDWRGDGTRRS